jgi:hypothetical protein
MAEKKDNKKLKQIITDLQSGDAKKMTKSIKALESHGDSSVIAPLAEILLKGVNEKNEAEIVELLSSLKDTTVVVEIMDVLENEKYRPIRQKLLTTVWNTKVDFSDYVDSFVEIATKGDFMEALECLTIIENLEGPFMEESILECQLHLKNYIEKGDTKDKQKAYILSEIAIKIKDIDRTLIS